jgi:CheY-like chemotaxis protein
MRPCILVVDNEYPGSIPTRKLVLESAKLNVLTAFTPDEAIQALQRFPNIDGIVLDTELTGRDCAKLIEDLRGLQPDMPIITISPTGQTPCGNENIHVSSYDTLQLIEAVRELAPQRMSYIVKREKEISSRLANP